MLDRLLGSPIPDGQARELVAKTLAADPTRGGSGRAALPQLLLLMLSGHPGTATVIASWIRHQPIPNRRLLAAQICMGPFACKEGAAVQPALEVAAASEDIASQDAAVFPCVV